MKQLLKYSFDSSIKNWPTLLVFDMLYKIFSYSALYVIASDVLELILKTAGVSYLSAENLSLILRSPICILLCLGMIFLTALFVFFETVALCVYCEAGWNRRHISIVQLVKQTLAHCKKLFRIQNLLMFLGFILLSVLTVLPFSPYMLQWFVVPEFIMDFIKDNMLLFSAFTVVTVIANFICLLFLFVLPNVLFHNQSMRAAWKEGMRLLRNRKAVTMFRLIAAFAVFVIGIGIVLGLGILALVYSAKYTGNPLNAVETFMIRYYRALPAAVFVTVSLSAIWLFSILIALYHQYRGDVRSFAAARGKIKLFQLMAQGVGIAAIVIAIGIFSETELGGEFIAGTNARPQVVAHRSGAAYAPENTMAALDQAISMKIDMVEIDVQQLKDRTLILLHDDSFHRTAGVNKKVWEAGYDEVKSYDTGSWFSPEFAGEPVPKLEDFLKRAKDNIQVMIELKYTGHETNLVEGVVALIEKYDLFGQCNIGSMNLELLKEVKASNPRIETVYITPLLYSVEYAIDFVDAYSVETTMVTREMVSKMHWEGKKVYGWTANSADTIAKNLRSQVDGIVTDNPELVNHYVMQTWHNQLLDMLLQTFFGTNLTDAEHFENVEI